MTFFKDPPVNGNPITTSDVKSDAPPVISSELLRSEVVRQNEMLERKAADESKAKSPNKLADHGRNKRGSVDYGRNNGKKTYKQKDLSSDVKAEEKELSRNDELRIAPQQTRNRPNNGPKAGAEKEPPPPPSYGEGGSIGGNSPWMVVISYQRYEMGINMKDMMIKWQDNYTVDVLGYRGILSNLLGQALILVGQYDVLDVKDEVIDSTTDGLFYIVRRRPHMIPDVWFRPVFTTDANGVQYRFIGTPKDNLRYCLYRCVVQYVTLKMAVDRQALAWEVQRQYMSRYGDIANIKGEIAAMIPELWVIERLEAYLDQKINDRPNVFRNVAKAIISNRYPTQLGLADWIKYGCFQAARGILLGGLAYWVVKGSNKPAVGHRVVAAGVGCGAMLTHFAFYGFPGNSEQDVIRGIEPRRLHPELEPYYDPVKNIVHSFTLGEKPIMAPACARSFPKVVVTDRIYPQQEPTAVLRAAKERPKEAPKWVKAFGSLIMDFPMVIPANVDENLEAALKIRMGFKRSTNPQLCEIFTKFCMSEIDKMARIEVKDIDNETYLKAQYGPTKAKDIMEAGDELDDTDAWSELFVKTEAYMGKDSDNFKPRMIWNRSLRVVKKFSRFFHQIGDAMKKAFSFDGNEFYVAGSTPVGVGGFAEKMQRFLKKYALDVKNWDGSLNKMFLTIEKYFLTTVVKGMPEELDWLLEHWYHVWGKTRGGLKYMADWGRRSGDLWTSTFNSLLNCLLLRFVMFMLGDPAKMRTVDSVGMEYSNEYMSMVMGDDSVFATDQDIDPRAIKALYSDLGMAVEVEIFDDITDVGFCSGRFWRHGGSFIWGNLPFRQLAKFGINYNNHPKKLHARLLFGMARGLLCTSGHIPIIGTFLRRICETADEAGLKPYYDNSHLNPGRIQGGSVHYPLSDTYQQFCDVYGLDQFVVESYEAILEKEIHISGFPYVSLDEVFEKCAFIDVPNDSEPPDVELEIDVAYTIYKAPLIEEAFKLKRAQVIGIIPAALEFADHEIETQGGPRYLRFLHCLFTTVSSLNFSKGVYLHSCWNWLALCCAATPCTRRKKTPGRKVVTKAAERKVIKKVKAKVKHDFGGNQLAHSALSEGGSLLGGFFGPSGEKIGRKAGEFVSHIFGFGDYKIKSNSLLSSSSGAVPVFGSSSTPIRHKEFIANVTGSVGFASAEYVINPGRKETFPWLSAQANQYCEYRLKGCIFEFVPLAGTAVGSTNTALGAVCISTQYNVYAPSFTSLLEMNAHAFSCDGAPYTPLIHPIECNPAETPVNVHYVGTGALSDSEDRRLYDMGVVTVATIGMQAANIVGQLWVSYDIEFEKPRLVASAYTNPLHGRISNGPCSSTNTLGTVQRDTGGNMDLSVSTSGAGWDRIQFPYWITTGHFMVLFLYTNGSGNPGAITYTYSNCAAGTTGFGFNLDTIWEFSADTSAYSMKCTLVTVTGSSAYMTVACTIATADTTAVDVYVLQIPASSEFPLSDWDVFSTFSNALVDLPFDRAGPRFGDYKMPTLKSMVKERLGKLEEELLYDEWKSFRLSQGRSPRRIKPKKIKTEEVEVKFVDDDSVSESEEEVILSTASPRSGRTFFKKR